MIVPVAVPGSVINVAEDSEAELRIFVQHLSLWHVIREIRFNKVVVL